jgi:choline-sulfatase
MPLPLDAYVDVWHGKRTVDWIESYQGGAPFNLFLGFPGPHDPWDAPREAVEQYAASEIELPASIERPEVPDSGPLRGMLKAFMALSSSDTATPDRIRAVRRAYYANVTLIDEAVGRIRAALERRGWLDDTWIIYTGDHGEMNGEHSMFSKMVFYDASLRIPLIVRPPGGTSAREVDGLVEQMDLAATLRHIAGAPDIPGSEGRSLLDTIRGGPAQPRDLSISENFGYACFETDRYKLVVHEDTLAPLQLFDRTADPTEDRNGVGLPEYRTVVEELMDTHVRPFFETPPQRPHEPTIRSR